MIPKKLPIAELKIAAACNKYVTIADEATPTSFPPTDFVRMTADETGGGIHPTTCKLLIIKS